MKEQTDTFKHILENKQHNNHSPKQEKLARGKANHFNLHKQEHYHNRGNR